MNISVSTITVFLAFISFVGVFLSISILLETPLVYFFKDKPGTRKIHQRTIPRMGGACIALFFIVTLFLWDRFMPPDFPRLSNRLKGACVFITMFIFIIGFFDDLIIFRIKNRVKFILEVLIAVGIIFIFGIKFPELRFYHFVITWDVAVVAFSILWMVGLSNAINFIDGIDGLAGMITLISLFILSILCWHVNALPLAFLCAVLIGGIAGFLPHNISPARVFLGDTGSLLFGMIISMLLIALISWPGSDISLMTIFFIVGFPLLDVSVAMARRFFRSLSMGRGLFRSLHAMTVADSEHSHHRLIYFGLTHMQAMLVLAIFHATLCVLAFLTHFFPNLKYIVFTYAGVMVLWFLYWLSFFDKALIWVRDRIRLNKLSKLYRIAVVDADPIMHHALIHNKQDLFIFEFVSGEEIKKSIEGESIAMNPLMHPDEKFRTSADWLEDTHEYSLEALVSHKKRNKAKKQNAASNPQFSESAEYLADAYRVVLINCRDDSEIDGKIAMANRLLRELSCMIIMIVEQPPNNKPAEASPPSPRIEFVKKPFYVPILLNNIYQFIDKGENWRSSKSFLKLWGNIEG